MGGGAAPAEHEGVLREVCTLLKSRQFCLQCFCYSLLTGVAYSVPGFATTALSDIGKDDFTDDQSAWVNFAFIFSGCSAGLLLGRLTTRPAQYPTVLKVTFLTSAFGLLAVVLLIVYQGSIAVGAVYTLVIVATVVTGAASLSFLGVAFSAIVEATHPVDAEFSGGFIEMCVQLWGFMFTYASGDLTSGFYMFLMVAVPTWLCALMMCTIYHQEFNKSNPPQPDQSLSLDTINSLMLRS